MGTSIRMTIAQRNILNRDNDAIALNIDRRNAIIHGPMRVIPYTSPIRYIGKMSKYPASPPWQIKYIPMSKPATVGMQILRIVFLESISTFVTPQTT